MTTPDFVQEAANLLVLLDLEGIDAAKRRELLAVVLEETYARGRLEAALAFRGMVRETLAEAQKEEEEGERDR